MRLEVDERERSTLQELTVLAAVIGEEEARFEIALTSGTKGRVPVGFGAGALVRLLEVMARGGAC